MQTRQTWRSEDGRPKRWRVRVSLAIAAAVFAIVVLWASGFEPEAWWKARHSAAPGRAVAKPATPYSGAISVVQPTPLGTDSSVSKVPLPLHLAATRPGRNSREGYADIGVDVRTPQTYRAGAILANAARIEEIYSNYIVLARDGRATRLYVEGQNPPGNSSDSLTEGVKASLLAVGGNVPRPLAVADSRDALTDYIRVAPVYDGEKVTALEVYANAHSGAFQELGLLPGDRITSVDGKLVSDQRAAIASLSRLTSGQALTVTVRRGGETRILALDGSILVNARQGT